MAKKLVSIRIDEELHRTVKKMRMNLSGFVNRKLKELLYIQNHQKWASGLGVMTLPLQGRDRQFNSGLAHLPDLPVFFWVIKQ